MNRYPTMPDEDPAMTTDRNTTLRVSRQAIKDWHPLLVEVHAPTDPTEAPDPTLSPAYIEVLRVRLRDLLKPRYPGDTGRVSCSPYWPLDGIYFP